MYSVARKIFGQAVVFVAQQRVEVHICYVVAFSVLIKQFIESDDLIGCSLYVRMPIV